MRVRRLIAIWKQCAVSVEFERKKEIILTQYSPYGCF